MFLSEDQQDIVFGLLSENSRKAEVLSYLEDAIVERLIADYSVTSIAAILKEMDDDDAADLLANVDEEKAGQILRLMGREEREEIEDLLSYEDDTAGGIMTTDFVMLRPEMTASQALIEVQRQGEEPEMVFYLYVVDDDERLVGVVSLREVVQAPGETLIESIMTRDIKKVRTDTDQEEVASVIARYDLLAVPVVDAENVLSGIITVDDVIDVIRAEATEDILKQAGVHEELLDDYSVRRNVTSRLPWLLATWGGGIIVMNLISSYQDSLQKVLPLAAFIPIVLGMAGNMGSQSATIIVRGIALGKVDVNRIFSTIAKEALTGLIMGCFYGFLLGTVAFAKYSEIPKLGLVVGLAMCSGITIASIVGTLIPMIMQKLKVDPAIATGPFVATILDMTGIFVYFHISMLLL